MGGEEAVVCLTGLVSVVDVADDAARALRKIGAEAERAVREALDSGGSAERSVLLPMVTRASAIDQIVRCAADADAVVRALACDALARVGATKAVATLFKLLADDNPGVQQAVGEVAIGGAFVPARGAGTIAHFERRSDNAS